MARKVSDTQRIINFGMGADEASLNQAIESLTAIRSNRYPKEKRQQSTRKPRKPRTLTPPPPASNASDPSSSES